MVTLLTKPGCVQCNQTKKALEKVNVPFEMVDMAEDATALERAKSLGYLQAPVVINGEDHWSGFRPDKIAALAQN